MVVSFAVARWIGIDDEYSTFMLADHSVYILENRVAFFKRINWYTWWNKHCSLITEIEMLLESPAGGQKYCFNDTLRKH